MTSKQYVILIFCLMGLVNTGWATNNIEFNFQGRIYANGAPAVGTGQVKFAIVNDSGTFSVWSNDETSQAGSEPFGATPVSLNAGIFDVMVGDQSLGMQPINAALF